MTRAVVLLMFLPTLLMPPGVCICRVIVHVNKPVESIAFRSVNEQHPLRPGCTCESCRARFTQETGDRLPPAEPMPGNHDEHCPGCPLSMGAIPLTVQLPCFNYPIELNAIETTFNIDEFKVCPTREITPTLSSVDPPLFLSHCTLLI